jgi:hypothetical protein
VLLAVLLFAYPGYDEDDDFAGHLVGGVHGYHTGHAYSVNTLLVVPIDGGVPAS